MRQVSSDVVVDDISTNVRKEEEDVSPLGHQIGRGLKPASQRWKHCRSYLVEQVTNGVARSIED